MTMDRHAPGAPRNHEQMLKAGLTRRDFLARTAAAAGLALASGGLFVAFHDPNGPAAQPPEKVLSGLPDFSLPEFAGKNARMAIVRGPDRVQTLGKGLDALGGIGTFIARGDSVLIKVNAAFASPPSLGATSHPELVAALAGLCFQAGAKKVAVTDNPIHNPESCFELAGITGAVRGAGASLVLPSENLFTPVSLSGGRLIQNWPVLAKAFAGVNKVIAVAPIKDHARAGASMILKNWYGLLGGRRSVFHQDINGIIAELSMLIRPTLCILDGTTAMLTNGPTGGSMADLAATNTMILSTDPVAADAAGLTVLGRTPEEVPYLLAAQALGAGTAEYQSLSPALVEQGS